MKLLTLIVLVLFALVVGQSCAQAKGINPKFHYGDTVKFFMDEFHGYCTGIIFSVEDIIINDKYINRYRLNDVECNGKAYDDYWIPLEETKLKKVRR